MANKSDTLTGIEYLLHLWGKYKPHDVVDLGYPHCSPEQKTPGGGPATEPDISIEEQMHNAWFSLQEPYKRVLWRQYHSWNLIEENAKKEKMGLTQYKTVLRCAKHEMKGKLQRLIDGHGF